MKLSPDVEKGIMEEKQAEVIPIKPETKPLDLPKPQLSDLETTVKNLVLVHSLLAEGLFIGAKSQKLNQARGFIESIHMQSLAMLENHPDYKKVEDAPEKKE